MRRLLRLRLLWWLAMWLLRRLTVRVGLHSIVEARKSGVGLIFKAASAANLAARRARSRGVDFPLRPEKF